MFRALISSLLAGGTQFADGDRKRISDQFPDVEMRNQFRQRLWFRRDFIDPQGVVIINTMYTTCRGSCPATSDTIELLRKELSPVFRDRLKFLSVTLEPEIDNSGVLLAYSKVYGAGTPSSELCEWHFACTAVGDLDVLRRSLGFFELDPTRDQDITQHASLLLIGNVHADRWCKLPADLDQSVLLETIRRFAGRTPQERFGIPG